MLEPLDHRVAADQPCIDPVAMLVLPVPETAFLDPFSTATTLVLICNIRDPVTGQTYSRDPRYVAQKAETER